MDASSSVTPHSEHEPHDHEAAHDHHELPFWRKYIISTDHKVIGIQYGISGRIFLFFGFCLMMLMRWQLAYPGTALPIVGNLIERILGPGSMTNGVMTPEFYNSLGAMDGTIARREKMLAPPLWSGGQRSRKRTAQGSCGDRRLRAVSSR